MKFFTKLVLVLALSFSAVGAYAETDICARQLYSTLNGSIVNVFRDPDCGRADAYCDEARNAGPLDLSGDIAATECKQPTQYFNGSAVTYRLYFHGLLQQTFTATRYSGLGHELLLADREAAYLCHVERNRRAQDSGNPIDWQQNSVCTGQTFRLR